MPISVLPSGAKALDTFPVPSRPKGGSTGLRLSASTLSGDDITALSSAREGRWRPGLADQPLHSEIFAETRDASGAGMAMALARDALAMATQGTGQRAGQNKDPLAEQEDRRQVLWVQDRRAIQRSGRPYVHGLPPELRDRLIHVEAASPEDALFALEEGLRCRDLACVIGEIVGNPRALDFTASRRLSLTAEKHGVALWLVRLEAEADLSSARMRWRVEAAPSAASLWNAPAPGVPAWKAELFRARSHAPGKWIMSNDNGHLSAQNSNQRVRQAANTQDTGDLVRPTVGRSLAIIGRA